MPFTTKGDPKAIRTINFFLPFLLSFLLSILVLYTSSTIFYFPGTQYTYYLLFFLHFLLLMLFFLFTNLTLTHICTYASLLINPLPFYYPFILTLCCLSTNISIFFVLLMLADFFLSFYLFIYFFISQVSIVSTCPASPHSLWTSSLLLH